jgi:WD40 repeat protein
MPLDGMSLAVSSDGARLLGVDSSGDVEEWNLRSGAARKLPGLGSSQANYTIAVSPDLSTLAVADATDVVTQQAATGKQLGDVSLDFGTNFFSVPGEPGTGQPGVAFSPDGNLVAYNDSHGNVYLLNVTTQASQVLPAPAVPPSSQTNGMDALAFSPDGKTLAVGTYTGAIFLWNVPARRLLATLNDLADTSSDAQFTGRSQVEALAFGESGALLAAGDQNGNVYLWDVGRRRVTGALAGSPAVSSAGTGSLAFSPDGGLLAASFASDIRVWSVGTGRRLAILDGANSVPSGPIAFALGGQLLVSLENIGPITEWDLR